VFEGATLYRKWHGLPQILQTSCGLHFVNTERDASQSQKEHVHQRGKLTASA